jgi:hypothetical protein
MKYRGRLGLGLAATLGLIWFFVQSNDMLPASQSPEASLGPALIQTQPSVLPEKIGSIEALREATAAGTPPTSPRVQGLQQDEAEPAEDPFVSDTSPEIEYAFELVLGPHATIATAQNAANIFDKCLKAVPTQERCLAGYKLAAARQRSDWVAPVSSDVVLFHERPPTRAERNSAALHQNQSRGLPVSDSAP